MSGDGYAGCDGGEVYEKVARLKREVEYWKTAALCEKPRGSCRACPTTNCYFKDRFEEERKSLNLVERG